MEGDWTIEEIGISWEEVGRGVACEDAGRGVVCEVVGKGVVVGRGVVCCSFCCSNKSFWEWPYVMGLQTSAL